MENIKKYREEIKKLLKAKKDTVLNRNAALYIGSMSASILALLAIGFQSPVTNWLLIVGGFISLTGMVASVLVLNEVQRKNIQRIAELKDLIQYEKNELLEKQNHKEVTNEIKEEKVTQKVESLDYILNLIKEDEKSKENKKAKVKTKTR